MNTSTASILAVAQKGESILQLKAEPIHTFEFRSLWLSHFIDAMFDTMNAKSGVGIAAPQVYLSKRIIIVASRPNQRYPDALEMQPMVMINPEIIFYSDLVILGEEGCLSVSNQRAHVARAKSIRVRYFNLDGKQFEDDFNGFPARIIQHEVDHLNGILFVDRVVAQGDS